MLKKWVLPIAVIIFSNGLLIGLAGWLQIEISWAIPITSIVSLLLFFEIASHFSNQIEDLPFLGPASNQTLLKFFGIFYLIILGFYAVENIRGKNIPLASLLFVTATLSIYILVYVAFARHFDKSDISAETIDKPFD